MSEFVKIEFDNMDNFPKSIEIIGYADYFDDEYANLIIQRDPNEINLFKNLGFYPEYVRNVFKSIFIDKSVKLKFYAKFRTCKNGCSRPEEYANIQINCVNNYCIPNPSLCFFRDMGGYERYIREAFEDRDYLSYIEHHISATKNINLMDSMAARRMIECVFNDPYSSNMCLELPDGTITNVTGVLDFIGR